MNRSSLDDIAYLFMREGMRPFRLTENAMRLEAGFEDRPDNWTITVTDAGWRIQHETGMKEDVQFTSERAAMDYLWPRLQEPLLPKRD